MTKKPSHAFPWGITIAFGLNGFALMMVNYWIYNARWRFIEERGDYQGNPPTISRAISIDDIGGPFAVWITISGICLVIGVGLLMHHYWKMRQVIQERPVGFNLAMWIFLPGIVVFQFIAAIGMNFLSVYRLPHFNEMHMVGSYMFFLSQSVVVVLYTSWNHVLLKSPDALLRLERAGCLSQRWVRRRRALGAFGIVFTAVYFTLFKMKNIIPEDDAPWIYDAYVTSEPMLISTFLFVLVLAHVDKFKRSAVDL